MTLSYNISGDLKKYLIEIEKLRSEILLYPLSFVDETKLKWKVSLKRDNKNVFDYLKQEWYVTNKLITLSTIKKLYEVTTSKKFGGSSGFTEYSEKKINIFLPYLQKSGDNPIIQAAIAQAEIIDITPFIDVSGQIARYMSYLVLYKYGLDYRGMLNLEEFYNADKTTYRKMVGVIKTNTNLTLWIEYFAYGVMKSLEKALSDIHDLKNAHEEKSKFWNLNLRQIKIIQTLDQPDTKVTNKEVQKNYKVSQITASRDLSKLVEAGLLFSHGKGRSVFYTKA